MLLVYGLPLLGLAGHREHAHEQEDHHLGHVGQHVRRAADGDARALADVLLDVVLHGDAAEGDGQDARHLEGLRCQVGEVGEHQDDQWLHNPGVVQEPAIDKYVDILDLDRYHGQWQFCSRCQVLVSTW